MNLQKHRKEILKNVGAVIEKPDVYEYLSAKENLEMFAKLSGVKPTQAKLTAQLKLVGLAERSADKVKEFSQGMKQRLGIAIALMHDPALIILDEPTNGLDPQGIADMRNLIFYLSRERKKTILVSSHLLSEIEQVATRLLIINKGKKIVEGTASELFHSSQTLTELETQDNESALLRLEKSEWKKYLLPQRGSNILLKLPPELIPELNIWLVKQNIRVVSLQKRNSLEDYFLQIISGSQHVDTYSN